MPKTLQYAFVFSWFLLASAAVLAMNQTMLKDFDPHLTLSQHMMSLDFENNFVTAVQDVHPQRGMRIVHISSHKACFCEQLVKAHIRKIENQLAEYESREAHSIHIMIDESSPLQPMIPSTPAVALIDRNENLVYLGPYAQGSGCFSRSGDIDRILDAELKPNSDEFKRTAIIVSEAQGCYCA